jgi:ubiquinone/menaquinone biosynthesis C-methylase UbiE
MDDPLEVAAYDEADFSEVNRDLARFAIETAGARGRAIDLGTGPACIPLELCALAPGWRVVAVDVSRSMLDRARARLQAAGLSRRVALKLADAGAGPLPRSRFDLVLSNSLLHHLRDPVAFWEQVGRLAGGGGAVVLQDLARPESPERAARLVRKHAGADSALLQELFCRSLLAAYTPAELCEQLRFAGLRGLAVEMVSDRHLRVHGRLDGRR